MPLPLHTSYPNAAYTLYCMIRLLHLGLPAEGNNPHAVAYPFSPAQLTASPMCPAADNFFTHVCSQGGLSWLECPEDTPHQEQSQTVYLCGVATSSLDVARVLGVRGLLPVWGSVLALSQTSGRGQLGRSWFSPVGNLYAALRLPYLPPFTETAAAPAIGALLAEALADSDCPVHIKWPNDLVVYRPNQSCPTWNKVGGILLEERPLQRVDPACSGQKNLLIAGIGLNIISAPHTEEMRTGYAVPAGCLPLQTPISLTELWRHIVNCIFFCYVKEIQSKVPSAWRFLAEQRLAFRGQPVMLVDGPGECERYEGILEGLDEAGGVCLRNATGCTHFLSGSLYPPSAFPTGTEIHAQKGNTPITSH